MKATSCSVQAPSLVASPSEVADLMSLFLRVMLLILASSKRLGTVIVISLQDNPVIPHQRRLNGVPGGFYLWGHVLPQALVLEAAGCA